MEKFSFVPDVPGMNPEQIEAEFFSNAARFARTIGRDCGFGAITRFAQDIESGNFKPHFRIVRIHEKTIHVVAVTPAAIEICRLIDQMQGKSKNWNRVRIFVDEFEEQKQ